MVVPGYFESLSCPELVEKYRTATQRVRTLILLMEKSSEEFGGALVNAVAYNTEYAKARSVQKHAEEAAVLKRGSVDSAGFGGGPSLRSQRNRCADLPRIQEHLTYFGLCSSITNARLRAAGAARSLRAALFYVGRYRGAGCRYGERWYATRCRSHCPHEDLRTARPRRSSGAPNGTDPPGFAFGARL
jgi:hypothetical protein